MERKYINFYSAASTPCSSKPCEENIISIVNTVDEYWVPVKDIYIKDPVRGIIERKSIYTGIVDKPKIFPMGR